MRRKTDSEALQGVTRVTQRLACCNTKHWTTAFTPLAAFIFTNSIGAQSRRDAS